MPPPEKPPCPAPISEKYIRMGGSAPCMRNIYVCTRCREKPLNGTREAVCSLSLSLSPSPSQRSSRGCMLAASHAGECLARLEPWLKRIRWKEFGGQTFFSATVPGMPDTPLRMKLKRIRWLMFCAIGRALVRVRACVPVCVCVSLCPIQFPLTGTKDANKERQKREEG